MLRQPNGQTQETVRRLVTFGGRRCLDFLGGRSKSVPLFGLRNLHRLIRHLKVEDRISLLRSVAQDVSGGGNTLLIRYCQDDSTTSGEYYAYATTCPVRDKASKRTHEGIGKFVKSHCRWVPEGETCPSAEKISRLAHNEIISDTAAGKLYWRQFPTSFLPYLDTDNNTDRPQDKTHSPTSSRHESRKITFEFVCGDPMRAAIFRVQGSGNKSVSVVSDDILEEILSRGIFDWGLFLRELEASSIERDTVNSLIALDAAAGIYDLLPGSTIPINVTLQSLLEAPWIPQELARRTGTPRSLSLTLSQSFACILMFETGDARVDPKHLENVMAMCSGHSIYIPEAFLQDPSESTSLRIWLVMGSVGKPGVVFFVPPPESMMRDLDPNSWHIINHCSWNGKLGNSFGQAYLNLSLTDWSTPLVTATPTHRQTQLFGTQITFQESVVSLSDSGTWVADLDILSGLNKSDLLVRLPEPLEPCNHSKVATPSEQWDLIVIDNWAELLDPPESPAIIRCQGNWIGRLGATIFSVQKGHPTILLPSKVACETCVAKMIREEEARQRFGPEERKRAFFIC